MKPRNLPLIITMLKRRRRKKPKLLHLSLLTRLLKAKRKVNKNFFYRDMLSHIKNGMIRYV
jgi:hypothetical protein